MRRRHTLALFALLLALFVAVRLPGIGADPPESMPNRGDLHELLQEPPAKAHEARDFALFGSFAPNAADGYTYWLAQSPAWVVPLGYALRTFGVTYVALRAFAIAGAALGFLALLALARERMGTTGVLAAALFFGFNYYWVQYSKYGLLEPNLDGWLTLAAFGVHRAQRRVGWLALAVVAFAFAALTKQTAFFALPLLLAFAWRAFARSRGEGRLARAAPVAFALVVAALFAAYASRPAYARTLERNLVHAAENREGGSVDLGAVHLVDVIGRALSAERWGVFYFSVFTVAGALAIVQIVRVARAALARRGDAWDVLVAGWALSALAVLTVSPLAQNRFFLILFPPVALLAGRVLDDWTRYVRAPLPRVALPAIVLVNHLVVSASPMVDWLAKPAHDVARASERIRRAVEKNPAPRREPVVVGLLAAPLLFETPFRQYYVKAEFNATHDALVALAPTHAVLLRDGCITSHILASQFPGVLKIIEPIDAVRFQGVPIEVYALPDLAHMRRNRPGMRSR